MIELLEEGVDYLAKIAKYTKVTMARSSNEYVP